MAEASKKKEAEDKKETRKILLDQSLLSRDWALGATEQAYLKHLALVRSLCVPDNKVEPAAALEYLKINPSQDPSEKTLKLFHEIKAELTKKNFDRLEIHDASNPESKGSSHKAEAIYKFFTAQGIAAENIHFIIAMFSQDFNGISVCSAFTPLQQAAHLNQPQQNVYHFVAYDKKTNAVKLNIEILEDTYRIHLDMFLNLNQKTVRYSDIEMEIHEEMLDEDQKKSIAACFANMDQSILQQESEGRVLRIIPAPIAEARSWINTMEQKASNSSICLTERRKYRDLVITAIAWLDTNHTIFTDLTKYNPQKEFLNALAAVGITKARQPTWIAAIEKSRASTPRALPQKSAAPAKKSPAPLSPALFKHTERIFT